MQLFNLLNSGREGRERERENNRINYPSIQKADNTPLFIRHLPTIPSHPIPNLKSPLPQSLIRILIPKPKKKVHDTHPIKQQANHKPTTKTLHPNRVIPITPPCPFSNPHPTFPRFPTGETTKKLSLRFSPSGSKISLPLYSSLRNNSTYRPLSGCAPITHLPFPPNRAEQ